MEDRDNVLHRSSQALRHRWLANPDPDSPPGPRPNRVVALVIDSLTTGATARIYVAVIRHLIPFGSDVSMEAPVVVARRKTPRPQRHHRRLRP